MEPTQARGMIGRLAGFSARKPWPVVSLWILVLVAAMAIIAAFPADLTTDAEFTNTPESVNADTMIFERYTVEKIESGQLAPRPDEYLIIEHPSLTVDDPEFKAFTSEAVSEITALGRSVDPATTYFLSGDETLVSDNRRATIVPVVIYDSGIGEPYLETVDELDGSDGFTVVTGGQITADLAFEQTAESDLLTGETIGISVALIVLVIVFGTLVSAGLPIILALVSITAALGMTNIIGHQFELSVFVTNMIVMIGLAVGIDYALFIVGRYREESRKGLGYEAAIIRTGDSSTKAVVFSGLTVVIALLGMLIVPSTIFKSLGAGAVVVVIFAVLASLTLLPASISLLHNWINRGTGRVMTIFLGVFLLLFGGLFMLMDISIGFTIVYFALAVTMFVLALLNKDPFHRTAQPGSLGFWDRIARFVMKHPGILATVTAVALLALASAYLTIDLGQSGISSLPQDTSPARAFNLIQEDFSGISLESPHQIAIDADTSSAEVQEATASLVAMLEEDPDFGPVSADTNDAGDLGVLFTPSTHDTQSSDALESIERLREDYIPEAFGSVADDVLVGGLTAETVDANGVVAQYTPYVFAFVLGMSLILLLLAFRSIVVPVKSVIMNLLSVGASYGILVLVFQHGYGNQIFGFHQVERIEFWLPLMMFTILFGLSMDYHVFLLSRIREHYDITHNNEESVVFGLHSTASIITGAALIMVAVFGGFAMGQLSMFEQLGFGLAIAVILDATIIRMVLVPATMKMLGDWNWYLPSWLNWLPNVNVEGVPDDQEPAVDPTPAD